jgi:hypothetical protein
MNCFPTSEHKTLLKFPSGGEGSCGTHCTLPTSIMERGLTALWERTLRKKIFPHFAPCLYSTGDMNPVCIHGKNVIASISQFHYLFLSIYIIV